MMMIFSIFHFSFVACWLLYFLHSSPSSGLPAADNFPRQQQFDNDDNHKIVEIKRRLSLLDLLKTTKNSPPPIIIRRKREAAVIDDNDNDERYKRREELLETGEEEEEEEEDEEDVDSSSSASSTRRFSIRRKQITTANINNNDNNAAGGQLIAHPISSSSSSLSSLSPSTTSSQSDVNNDNDTSPLTPPPKKRLLIGYLAGTPFGALGDNILTAGKDNNAAAAKSTKSNANAKQQLFANSEEEEIGESATTYDRQKRLAEPAPDAAPLERLQVVGTNKTILLKDLAIIFQANNIIGSSKYVQGHQISGAMRYALEVINKDSRLLPDYELTFKFYDTRGQVKESVKAVMELWKEGAVAFIGPEDSCQTEAMMAAAVNLPMISYKCAESMADKTKYNTFARTVPAEGEASKSAVALLRHFRWYKFTIIHQDDQLHKQLVEDIQKWVEKFPFMAVQNTTSYRASFNIDTKSSTEQVKQIVHETYLNTRVYVVLGDQGFLQLMLLEMHKLNLFSKGEYAVVYVDHTYGYMGQDDAALNRYYRPTIYTIGMDKSEANSEADTALSRLMEISRSLFVVIPTPVSFNDSKYVEFWRKVVQYNSEEPFKVYRVVANTTLHKLNTRDPIVNRYASYLYDAVILYAEALHETIQAKGSYTNGTEIMRRIWGKRYRSMQGFYVKMDEHGDAKGNFTLLTRQKVNNSMYNFTHSMVPTGLFVEAENDELPALQLRDGMTIDWVAGAPPAFEPECGFHNERCIQQRSRTVEITGGLVSIFCVVAGLVGFMVYRNRKIEKELAGLIWKIEPKEIQFISRDGHSADICASRLTIGSQESDYGGGLLSGIDMHCLAKYKGALVAIKEIQYGRRLREITRATKMEMKKMRALHHDNVNSFMGIILKPELIYVVREYCAKGSLFDVLLNDTIKLDELFTASFVDDLIKAMIYVHESEIRVHGNLKSTNCVITSRWSLQVADYGLHELREGQIFEEENQRYRALLWTAPEILLNGAIDRSQRGTQKGDVFSFGIVLHEIFTRTGPYGIEWALRALSARDVYMLIVKTRQNKDKVDLVQKDEEELQTLGLVNMNKPYLPSLDEMVCQNYVKETLCQCWDERPEQRPDFRTIRQRLKPLFKGILRRNIMDHMMAMMEKHQNNLELLVCERTMALNEEKKRVETLLHRMLPDSVADQLALGEDVVPESYDAVTIYFSDIVGFTSLSAESTPMEVVSFLNALYTLFDGIIRRYDVYKVETIGDAYMVVSGLPKRNDDLHAGEIATMALHLLKAVESFEIPHRQDKKLLLRIGIHTGPCVAGVVGKTMPRYCLFGDTVNTASRMESNGLALKIHCSEYTKKALDSLRGYILEERGLVPMKGKGEMLTYWLLAKQEFVMASPVTDEAPLFHTGKPPTANVHRRKGGAESLLHLPTRGESLSAIVRRGGGAGGAGTGSGGVQPKLLQPAPAFSSKSAKPPAAASQSSSAAAGSASAGSGGGSASGSTRNSRILTTVNHHNQADSASASATGLEKDKNSGNSNWFNKHHHHHRRGGHHHHHHKPATATCSNNGTQRPQNLLIFRSRASSVKRNADSAPCGSAAGNSNAGGSQPGPGGHGSDSAFSGRLLRRQLSAGGGRGSEDGCENGERDSLLLADGLRKRSVSYPTNVQDLLDDMPVNMMVGGALLKPTTASSNCCCSSSASTTATTSASHTPRRRHSRQYLTPKGERDRPSSQPFLLLDSSMASLDYSANNNNKKNINTPKKETPGMRRRNNKAETGAEAETAETAEMTPFLTACQSAASSLNDDDDDDEQQCQSGGGGNEAEAEAEPEEDEESSNEEESPVPRKRSLSCGDAMIIANGPGILPPPYHTLLYQQQQSKIQNGSTPTTAAAADQSIIDPLTTARSSTNNSVASVSNFSAQSAPAAGAGVGGKFENMHHHHQNNNWNNLDTTTANLLVDADDDDSPLLSPARGGAKKAGAGPGGSAGCVTTTTMDENPPKRRKTWNLKHHLKGSSNNVSKSLQQPLFQTPPQAQQNQQQLDENGAGADNQQHNGQQRKQHGTPLSRFIRYL